MATSKTTLRGMGFVQSLVHGALMVSIGVYLVVLYVITREPKVPPPQTFEQLKVMFYALAGISVFVLLGVIPIMRGVMMPPRQKPEQLDDSVSEPLSKAARRALGKLLNASIISWGLSESVAVYGLMLGTMLHEMWPLYPFAALSTIALLVLRPRRSLLEEVARAADARARAKGSR